MTLDAYITIVILAITFALLIKGKIPPVAVFVGALTLTITFRLAPLSHSLKGFSNPGMLTIGALLMVAAVVIVSERKARQLGIVNPVRVVSSVVHSFFDHAPEEENVTGICIDEAYYEAGLGPEDLDLIELHDSSAVTELISYPHLRICDEFDAVKLLSDGDTRLGGKIPVNTSGGLLRKGHPVGATGVAQVVEVTKQLQGRCGERQVEGARVGLTHNGGGSIKDEVAAMNITILAR